MGRRMGTDSGDLRSRGGVGQETRTDRVTKNFSDYPPINKRNLRHKRFLLLLMQIRIGNLYYFSILRRTVCKIPPFR